MRTLGVGRLRLLPRRMASRHSSRERKTALREFGVGWAHTSAHAMTTFVDHLLERFEPKQRHLAYLVALLVLTFVLTVMLAFKAHRSEIARQQQAHAVLQDFSATAAREWGRYIGEYGGNAVVLTLLSAARAYDADRDLALDKFAGLADPSGFCGACDAYNPKVVWSWDPETATTAYQGSVAIRDALGQALAARASQRAYASLSDSIGISIIPFRDNRAVSAAVALYRLGPEGHPIGAMGYIVDAAVYRESLKLVFDTLDLVPLSLSRGARNGDLFSIKAGFDDVTVFSTSDDGVFSATHAVASGPAQHLRLDVGIRDGAATQLLVDGAITSGVPLLLTLLFAICGLILLALILVRREADLVRLRADFISSVSHELRTPLAQIRMFSETLMLNRVRSDVERRRSLEIIDQEARRLTHLVENVLLFSKSEGGRRQLLSPEPTDLAAEVRRAAESFGPMFRTRDVSLRTELQDRITVAVDRNALRQIMVNLVDNALKYGPAGQRITVGVALFDDQARVWVDDEGPGIPEAERDRVFDSFYRLQRDVSSRSSGSGIGLSVVRELARLHGGDVWVGSAPGSGARIVVQFPDAYLRAESSSEFAAAS
jgi:signal transduction histidine kinase